MFSYRLVKKVLVFVSLLTVCPAATYGYELFQPVQRDLNVSTAYILFAGKARNSESIMINNTKVYTASNGAFAHSVKLNDGENRIVVRSNYSTKVYNIYKKTNISKAQVEVQEFSRRPVLVKLNDTPLRSAPAEDGFNILSYLFKDTRILINGEKDGYYRVYLSEDKTAWIAKSDVENVCETAEDPAKFINMNSERYKNAVVQTISFTGNLPYTIEDKDKEIVFKVYNPELSESSVYTVNIPKPDKYFYHVSLVNGLYTVKVCEVPRTFEDCTILVDAGHGGSQKGAVGCLGDEEKNINLKIALELQQILKEKGAKVVMTRECDGNITLKDRIKIAKENDIDIYLSIHLNSVGDVSFNTFKHRGTSVFYFNNNSKELAKILEKSITKKAGTWKDGVKPASFAVIRPADYVGVLIETAYMINPFDTLLYTREDFARNAAEGIVEGISEYLNK